jgi:hypothetical protein
MRTDINGDNQIAIDEKHRAQIPFDVHRINGLPVKRRELVILWVRNRGSNGFTLKISQARLVEAFWFKLKS